MKNIYIAALFAGTALVPTASLAQTQPVQAQGSSCDQLVVFLRDTDQDAAGITAERAQELLEQRDDPACDTALRSAQANVSAAGTGARATTSDVVVDQDAAAVRVDVPEPEVTVQQTAPNVTVRQPQPEIMVRQPAPTVTVDIPQPEIIVRMPQPIVTVEQAEPQVSVQQAEPQVSITQPERPEVTMQQGEQAQVNVQGGQQARVTLEQNDEQPQVTYQSEQPQVRINQAEGAPQVRMEEATAVQTAEPMQQAPAVAVDQAAAPIATEPVPTASMATTPATTPAMTENREGLDLAVNRMAVGEQVVTVQDLIDYEVTGANGEELGDIEEIVNINNRLYGVIGAGGFLGLGEKQVAIPISSLVLSGEGLVAPDVTEAQVDSIQEFDINAYPALPRENNVTIGRM